VLSLKFSIIFFTIYLLPLLLSGVCASTVVISVSSGGLASSAVELEGEPAGLKRLLIGGVFLFLIGSSTSKNNYWQ
jgi:hypothetical protein